MGCSWARMYLAALRLPFVVSAFVHYVLLVYTCLAVAAAIAIYLHFKSRLPVTSTSPLRGCIFDDQGHAELLPEISRLSRLTSLGF